MIMYVVPYRVLAMAVQFVKVGRTIRIDDRKAWVAYSIIGECLTYRGLVLSD